MPRALAVVLILGACLACTSEPVVEEAPSGEPTSHHADHRGGRVHYIAAGAGKPALVLIHGWACDGRVWRQQMEPLAARHRLLVVDLPGHGRSDEPAEPYTMHLLAEATAAAMSDAGIDEAVLVAHSNGVPVARQLYRRHPERVLGMVLVDGALKAMFDEAMAEGILGMFRADDYRERVTDLVSEMPAPKLGDSERAEILAMALEQSQSAVVGGLEAALTHPEIWKEDPIGVPLLAVMAQQPAWTDEYEAFVRKLAPQVDYRVWADDTGHFLMVERPDEFNALVLEFVASLSATP